MTARSFRNFPVVILINFYDCHYIVSERPNKICLVLSKPKIHVSLGDMKQQACCTAERYTVSLFSFAAVDDCLGRVIWFILFSCFSGNEIPALHLREEKLKRATALNKHFELSSYNIRSCSFELSFQCSINQKWFEAR